MNTVQKIMTSLVGLAVVHMPVSPILAGSMASLSTPGDGVVEQTLTTTLSRNGENFSLGSSGAIDIRVQTLDGNILLSALAGDFSETETGIYAFTLNESKGFVPETDYVLTLIKTNTGDALDVKGFSTLAAGAAVEEEEPTSPDPVIPDEEKETKKMVTITNPGDGMLGDTFMTVVVHYNQKANLPANGALDLRVIDKDNKILLSALAGLMTKKETGVYQFVPTTELGFVEDETYTLQAIQTKKSTVLDEQTFKILPTPAAEDGAEDETDGTSGTDEDAVDESTNDAAPEAPAPLGTIADITNPGDGLLGMTLSTLFSHYGKPAILSQAGDKLELRVQSLDNKILLSSLTDDFVQEPAQGKYSFMLDPKAGFQVGVDYVLVLLKKTTMQVLDIEGFSVVAELPDEPTDTPDETDTDGDTDTGTDDTNDDETPADDEEQTDSDTDTDEETNDDEASDTTGGSDANTAGEQSSTGGGNSNSGTGGNPSIFGNTNSTDGSNATESADTSNTNANPNTGTGGGDTPNGNTPNDGDTATGEGDTSDDGDTNTATGGSTPVVFATPNAQPTAVGNPIATVVAVDEQDQTADEAETASTNEETAQTQEEETETAADDGLPTWLRVAFGSGAVVALAGAGLAINRFRKVA